MYVKGLAWSIVGGIQGTSETVATWIGVASFVQSTDWENFTHLLGLQELQQVQVTHTEEPDRNKPWRKHGQLFPKEAAPPGRITFCVFQGRQLPSQTWLQKCFQQLEENGECKDPEIKVVSHSVSYTLTLSDVSEVLSCSLDTKRAAGCVADTQA